MSEYKTIIQDLLQCKPVNYRSDFTKISDSLTAGVMLSQAFYWDGKSTKRSDGFFEKDSEEMYDETGLSDKQQRTAREKLAEKGFMEFKRGGDRGKMCYRVNFHAVEAALIGFYSAKAEDSDRQNGSSKIGQMADVDRQNGSSKISESADLSLQRIHTKNTTKKRKSAKADGEKTLTEIHDAELDKAIDYIEKNTGCILKKDKWLKLWWYGAIRLDGLDPLKIAVANFCHNPANKKVKSWDWITFFKVQAKRSNFLPERKSARALPAPSHLQDMTPEEKAAHRAAIGQP